MRGLALFLLCVILVPLVAGTTMVSLLVRNTWLSPSFYLASFRQVGMYKALTNSFGDAAVAAVVRTPQVPSQIPAAQRQQIEQLIRQATADMVTPAWVEQEVNRATSDILSFLRGNSASPSFRLDMRQPKERVRQSLSRLGIPAQSGLDILSRIPDESPLTRLPEGERILPLLNTVRPYVHWIVLALPVGLAVLLVLAGLAWVIAGNSSSAFAWLGLGVFVVGAVVTGLTVYGQEPLRQAVAALRIPPDYAALPLRQLAQALAGQFMNSVRNASLALTGAGAIVMLTSFLRRN